MIGINLNFFLCRVNLNWEVVSRVKLEDPYLVLGLPRSATPAEARSRYLALARGSHPDAQPADPHAAVVFQRYTEAYQRLRAPAAAAGGGTAPLSPPSPEFLARSASFLAYRERLRALRPPPPPPRAGGPARVPLAWRRAALALPALAFTSWWLMESARKGGATAK